MSPIPPFASGFTVNDYGHPTPYVTVDIGPWCQNDSTRTRRHFGIRLENLPENHRWRSTSMVSNAVSLRRPTTRKHHLRREATQAKRSTLKVPMSIRIWRLLESLSSYLSYMAHFFMNFGSITKKSGSISRFSRKTLQHLRCPGKRHVSILCLYMRLSTFHVPVWLNDYMTGINPVLVAVNLALFNLPEFRIALKRHVDSGSRSSYCQSCTMTSYNTMSIFLTASLDVVQHSTKKREPQCDNCVITLFQAEADSLIEGEVRSRQSSSSDSNTNVSPHLCLYMQGADVAL